MQEPAQPTAVFRSVEPSHAHAVPAFALRLYVHYFGNPGLLVFGVAATCKGREGHRVGRVRCIRSVRPWQTCGAPDQDCECRHSSSPLSIDEAAVSDCRRGGGAWRELPICMSS